MIITSEHSKTRSLSGAAEAVTNFHVLFCVSRGGKVSPQGRKFVHDLRIAGAGRIERATRRGKTGGTEAAARTGSGNRESPEQRRGNGPAADSGPAVRGTSGIFRRDAVLN
jgi:hypothetical protein